MSTASTRRTFLKSVGFSSAAVVGAACAPAAVQPAPAPAAAPAAAADKAWEQDWTHLVAAATKEAAVTVATTSHVGHRKWLQAFESAFPGIAVNHVAFPNTALLAPKLMEERKAGVYELDVLVASAVVALPRLVPNGVLDPIKPLI
ncbi:MAG: hypothetical protein AAB289_10240, partial [Chloroflexota bacterium]